MMIDLFTDLKSNEFNENLKFNLKIIVKKLYKTKAEQLFRTAPLSI